MNNNQIIANVALCNGIYNQTDLEYFASEGKEIPLHTFKGWKDRGMVIKKGEHGVEAKLWKKKSKNKKVEIEGEADGDVNEGFYLAKAFLFSGDQVEKMG